MFFGLLFSCTSGMGVIHHVQVLSSEGCGQQSPKAVASRGGG